MIISFAWRLLILDHVNFTMSKIEQISIPNYK